MELINLLFGTKIFIDLIKLNFKTLLNADFFQYLNLRKISPKNTTLYFSLLLETKDLLNATMNLLEEYNTSFDSKIPPAKLIEKEEE